MWNIVFTVLVVAQAGCIAALLLEHRRRTRLESERAKTAEALKESESRNSLILDALPDMRFILDERGTYLDWHANDLRDLYVPPDQFLGKTIYEVLPPAVSQRFREVFEQVLSTGTPARVEFDLQIDGDVRFFETRIVPGKNRTILSIVRNITELKRAEIELQELSSQLLSLQDEERRRIARELHDTTGQHLFAITINLENLKRMGAGMSPSAIALLNECRELCDRSLQEVRTLSYLSHPPGLERTDLVSALRWYVEGFRKRTGIAVDFQPAAGLARLPMEMEIDLFRVVQEGLFNVFRHSGSRNATVVLKISQGRVVLRMEDTGHGIEEEVCPIRSAAPAGVGITSIRERLRRWGGRMRIESNAGGVLLVADVPVPAEGSASSASSVRSGT